MFVEHTEDFFNTVFFLTTKREQRSGFREILYVYTNPSKAFKEK